MTCGPKRVSHLRPKWQHPSVLQNMPFLKQIQNNFTLNSKIINLPKTLCSKICHFLKPIQNNFTLNSKIINLPKTQEAEPFPNINRVILCCETLFSSSLPYFLLFSSRSVASSFVILARRASLSRLSALSSASRNSFFACFR